MTELTGRQQEIVNAAIELIAQGGVQKCTIKNLALELGITEPAIYRHFASKTAILTALLNRFDRNSRNHADEMNTDTRGINEIITFFRQRFIDFTEKPAFAAVIFAEEHFRNNAALRDKVKLIMDAHREMFTSIIAQGQTAAVIRQDIPAEEIFRMMFGAFRLLVKQWHLGGCAFNLPDAGEPLLQSFTKLFKPENG